MTLVLTQTNDTSTHNDGSKLLKAIYRKSSLSIYTALSNTRLSIFEDVNIHKLRENWRVTPGGEAAIC